MLSDYWTFTWFIHLLCSVPSPFVQCRWAWWGLRHRLLPTWGSNERTFRTLNFICITCIYKFFIYLQQNALYTTVLNGDGKFSLQWPGTLISVERKGDCRVNTCFLHTTFNTTRQWVYLPTSILVFFLRFSSPGLSLSLILSLHTTLPATTKWWRQCKVNVLLWVQPYDEGGHIYYLFANPANMKIWVFVCIMDWQKWESKIV